MPLITDLPEPPTSGKINYKELADDLFAKMVALPAEINTALTTANSATTQSVGANIANINTVATLKDTLTTIGNNIDAIKSYASSLDASSFERLIKLTSTTAATLPTLKIGMALLYENKIIIIETDLQQTATTWEQLISLSGSSQKYGFNTIIDNITVNIKQFNSSNEVVANNISQLEQGQTYDIVIEELGVNSSYSSRANKIRLTKIINDTGSEQTVQEVDLSSKDFTPIQITEALGTKIAFYLLILENTTVLSRYTVVIDVVEAFKPSLVNPYFSKSILTKNTTTNDLTLQADEYKVNNKAGLKYKILAIKKDNLASSDLTITYNSATITSSTEIPLDGLLSIATPNLEADYSIDIQIIDAFNALSDTLTLSIAVKSFAVDSTSITHLPINIDQDGLVASTLNTSLVATINDLSRIDLANQAINPLSPNIGTFLTLVATNPTNIYKTSSIIKKGKIAITQENDETSFLFFDVKYELNPAVTPTSDDISISLSNGVITDDGTSAGIAHSSTGSSGNSSYWVGEVRASFNFTFNNETVSLPISFSAFTKVRAGSYYLTRTNATSLIFIKYGSYYAMMGAIILDIVSITVENDRFKLSLKTTSTGYTNTVYGIGSPSFKSYTDIDVYFNDVGEFSLDANAISPNPIAIAPSSYAHLINPPKFRYGRAGEDITAQEQTTSNTPSRTEIKQVEVEITADKALPRNVVAVITPYKVP